MCRSSPSAKHLRQASPYRHTPRPKKAQSHKLLQHYYRQHTNTVGSPERRSSDLLHHGARALVRRGEEHLASSVTGDDAQLLVRLVLHAFTMPWCARAPGHNKQFPVWKANTAASLSEQVTRHAPTLAWCLTARVAPPMSQRESALTGEPLSRRLMRCSSSVTLALRCCLSSLRIVPDGTEASKLSAAWLRSVSYSDLSRSSSDSRPPSCPETAPCRSWRVRTDDDERNAALIRQQSLELRVLAGANTSGCLDKSKMCGFYLDSSVALDNYPENMTTT